MNEEIEEYYEELYRLYIDENQPLERRYRQLRESLERVVREKIQGNSLETTDLAARINYVATQYGLDLKEQNQLHTFRLTSNDILNHRKSPVKEEFLRDLRAVAYAYRKMFAQDIPLKLFSVLPKQEIASSGKKEKMEYIRDMLILHPHEKTAFHTIFRRNAGKMERVVTFLALLELIKQKEVQITQEKNFGEIFISRYDEGGAE